jgi:SAM-dependent methyltransferase
VSVAWLWELLGVPPAAEGEEVRAAGRPFVLRDGILRDARLDASAAQEQTSRTFGFKWQQRESFEEVALEEKTAAWLRERYGDVGTAPWWDDYGAAPVLLDAGCGAGVPALTLLAPLLGRVRYLGTDISEAIDVAAARFAERGLAGAFLQCNLMELPLSEGSVDVAFSEGVLHHTDSTQAAIEAVARLLAPGGRFLFYVYRRKGPVREFTDDHVRARLQALGPAEAWLAMEPLTRLGIALGELGVEVDVPEDVELLGIPAGRHDVQRLFYWHVAKAYYDADLSFDAMNHINFDWYAPRNAHRQSLDEVRDWCAGAGLEIEREDVQESGLTIVARRTP